MYIVELTVAAAGEKKSGAFGVCSSNTCNASLLLGEMRGREEGGGENGTHILNHFFSFARDLFSHISNRETIKTEQMRQGPEKEEAELHERLIDK